MNAKPVDLRRLAQSDIDEAIDYYLGEDAGRAAQGFADAVEQALRHLGRNPATGSPRYADEWALPGLRSWPLRRYPYIVFYVERPEQVEILRVLHAQRDFPAWMQSLDEL